MSRRGDSAASRIDAFDLEPGRVLAGGYEVVQKLGGGWEGEVYKVRERRTGIVRAAKLFFPHRNVKDRAVKQYAKKLDDLKHCSIVTQYHHSETVRFRKVPVTCLLSEFVDGELLNAFAARQAGGALATLDALIVTHQLAQGLEEIHAANHYHGDLHEENVLIRRVGIGFRLRLVDFFHYGRTTGKQQRDDVLDLARLLFDATGGRARYAAQPPEIKQIVKGLRRDLILKAYPTARRLRKHLEGFTWSGDAPPILRRRPGSR